MSMTRRDLLRLLGVGTGAAALTAAAPRSAARLLDTRSLVAPDAPALQFVRVGPVDGRRASVLARLDDTHRTFADGTREFLVDQRARRLMADAGIQWDVVMDDVLADNRARSGRAVAAQPGQRDDYRRWEDFEADLGALVAAHPTRARLLELPHTSLLGRRIFGIEIASDVPRRDGRPVVHHDGMHHAREWPAAEMPIMWAYDLLESYGTDPITTRIVDETRTVIVPNLNPDGFIRSRDSVAQADSSSDVAGGLQLALGAAGLESYNRKNLRNLSGVNQAYLGDNPSGYRYDNLDAHGVDVNRNYPFLWGDDAGSSGDFHDQTYRGTAPWSEPEAGNIRDLALSLAPITAITHHTAGGHMLYPWGRDAALVQSPDVWELEDLGFEMQLSNGYAPNQAFNGLYPTSGTSRDWMHASGRALVYTFEHGDEFHGPYADTIPAMYEINRGAFISHSLAALNPLLHIAVTGRVVDPAGNPIAATIRATKSFETPTADGQQIAEVQNVAMTAEDDGRFRFVLPPSTRPHLDEPEFGDGATEPYVIVVEAVGRGPVEIPVTAGRGETPDLGTVFLN